MAVTNNVVHSGTAPDTTLASDITAGSTSITLTDATGYPSPTGGQIAYLTLHPGTAGEELVSYTARSGNNLTGVSRGLGGTSASSHTAGGDRTVRHQWTALESDDVTKTALNTLGRISAIGDTLYADSTTTLARLAKGTSGQFLKQGASIPAWASLASSDISDLAEFIRDTMGTALTAGSNITITPSDGSDIITIASSASASINNFFIGAADLRDVGGGSPTLDGLLSSNTFWLVWLLDSAATDESVSTSLLIPSGWNTVDIDIWWTNAGAGAGNVRWEVGYQSRGDTETLTQTWTATASNIAAPAQSVVKKSTIISGGAVTAGELLGLIITRYGSNAGDTLANDAGLLGVDIRKAS